MGTVIGEAVRIKGDIRSREDLRLEGEAEGSLEVDGRLTVGQKGKIHANITAREVVMAGTVEGNIQASERVVLAKGADLTGDVKTAGIVIEDGAFFKGGIDIVRPHPGQAPAGPGAANPSPASSSPAGHGGVTAKSAGQ
jgi:cytoskeletal protein CcmA (bactofilin family)